MGGVVGSLFMLWVRSGFSSATVAAALTFFPPEPTYTIERDESDTNCKIHHLINENERHKSAAKVIMVRTKQGNEIPCFVFTYPEAKFTLIFSHGNATDCGAMYLRYLSLSRELKVNLVGYDYSGYGGASGTPSEGNTYADITAVYNYVKENMSSDPAQDIILYGQSVGSGPSIFLASQQPIRGLIVHSGLLSGMRVLTSSRMLACLDIYPNVERIRLVQCPTLIIHGKDDTEIGIHHGHGLYSALPESSRVEPFWVNNRGHNDIGETAECRPEYLRRLVAYVNAL
ncbi:hypothetical protein LEN26_016305 [Aphanomyces euteiches]|nr:hypothetical protein LEN26_016305 [Aphanomyces euteiches]